MLGDYYHSDYYDVVKAAVSNTSDFNVYVPWSDNNLINGKKNYNCSMAASNATCVSYAGLPHFRFQAGKTHRLRLMNMGAAALVHFSIDGHKMQVIANDFVPVVPYEADYITLGVAQRTDILVTADANPKETYWIRSTISKNCSVTHTTQAFAVLSYEGNDNIQLPKSNISEAAAEADRNDFLCKNVGSSPSYTSTKSLILGRMTRTRPFHFSPNRLIHTRTRRKPLTWTCILTPRVITFGS